MARVVGGIALAVGVVAAYAGYRVLLGTPFTVDQLVTRQSFQYLFSNPQLLTQVGFLDGSWLDRHGGRLKSFTAAQRTADVARYESYLRELDAFQRESLTPTQRTTVDIMRHFYGVHARLGQFPWLTVEALLGGLYPIEQFAGQQIEIVEFMTSIHPITNAKTARNYVARLEAFRPYFDQVLAEVERQRTLGVVPPRFVIDEVIDGVAKFRAPVPAEHVLVTSFRDRLGTVEGLDAATKASLVEAATRAVESSVYPAYARIESAFRALRASATDDDGVWKLPNGDAYYAARLYQATSTNLTPDEIHAIGLREVARDEAAIDAALRRVGLERGSVADRLDQLTHDPRFTFSDDDAGRERILTRYRQLLADMQGRLPNAFSRVPPQPLEVVRATGLQEATSSGAYYVDPALDGSRPGRFVVMLAHPADEPAWSLPTIAYHEGVPGHHFQAAWAHQIPDVPFVRRVLPLPAYTEGWALYAERVARELGAYDADPYGDIGRLQAELYRSVRLVVDTGIHAKHWARQQAIDYMREHTGKPLSFVTAEIERYIVNPGQACAYQVGMLKILELRSLAERQLGPRFDLKAFHDQVLDEGSLPLDVLEQHVRQWLAAGGNPPAPPASRVALH